jgi:transposase
VHDRDVNAAVNIAKEAMMVYHLLPPEEVKGKTIRGDRDWKFLIKKLTPVGQPVTACGEFLR